MIQYDYSLRNKNTLGVNVKSKIFAEVKNNKELTSILKEFACEKKIILGGGANVLFLNNFNGIIIKYSGNGLSILRETKKYVEVRIEGGMMWDDVVKFSVGNNLGGIENLVDIPGTVGGAIVQNIAAYGQSLDDVFVSCEAVNCETGILTTFSKKACGFGYRDSLFKKSDGRYLITSGILRLAKKPKPDLTYWSQKHGSVLSQVGNKEGISVQEVSRIISKMRWAKLPDLRKFGSAGSFFKNPVVHKQVLKGIKQEISDIQYYPTNSLRYTHDERHSLPEDGYVKVALGQLLDEGLGLRGYWKGNVGLYDKHALVLVTNKKATPNEIADFAEEIEALVYAKYKIKIEREVKYVS